MADEYFLVPREPHLAARWGVTEFRDCLEAAIAEGSSSNGVFGAKLLWARCKPKRRITLQGVSLEFWVFQE
jgi:LPS sulfotransferase NodH